MSISRIVNINLDIMNSLCRHNGIMSTYMLIFHDVDIHDIMALCGHNDIIST